MRSRWLWSLALVGAVSLASGAETCDAIAGRAYLATAHGAPYLADAPLQLGLFWEKNGNEYVGWVPVFKGRLYGHTRSGDALRLEFSQNGKVLGTARVGLKGIDPPEGPEFNVRSDDYAEDWEYRASGKDQMLSAFGTITVTFRYYDDNTEKERELGVRTLNVVKLADFDTAVKKYRWKPGVRYDDLLGQSYVWMRPPGTTSGVGKLYLYGWINRSEEYLKDLSYRIEVNGERLDLPRGVVGSGAESISAFEQEQVLYDKASLRTSNADETHLIWFKPYLLWGPKNDSPMKDAVYLIDHPGDWVVKIREAGETIRELRFKVDPQGLVVQHPESDPNLAGHLALGPMRAFVETYFPNPVTWDDRFQPAALKLGGPYGRPWVSAEAKAMVEALPPAKLGAVAFPATKPPTP